MIEGRHDAERVGSGMGFSTNGDKGMKLVTHDSPKSLIETLCVAQIVVARSNDPHAHQHAARLQRLINECARHRPVGSNGKHGDRHTRTCGCADKPWWFRLISPRVRELTHHMGWSE